MHVRFWGTRGSIAKPGSGTVRYGGNTSCVEIRSDSGTLVILDCGTGLQNLGQELIRETSDAVTGHILISHTHWDHIQGIPFFEPFFIPGNEWDIFAPRGLNQSLKDVLAGQMEYTYFPITLDAFGSAIRYHDILEGSFSIDGIQVRSQYLNHPALTLGYRLEVDGSTVVYASDHEPFTRQFSVENAQYSEQDQHHIDFLQGADLVIHDAQYTGEEYAKKIGWGHSSVEQVLDMCSLAGAKRLAITHHDPFRDDDGVDALQSYAREYAAKMDASLEVFAAQEGMTIELTSAVKLSKQKSSGRFSAVSDVTSALVEHSVLLCTNDLALSQLISKVCEAEKVELSVVTNSDELVKRAVEKTPSLVLIDESIVGGSFDEFIETVRKEVPLLEKKTPFIGVSSQHSIPDNASALLSDRLVEPFSFEYARTRVRAWLLRNTCRWLRAAPPEDEEERQKALNNLGILDTEPEERFDRITRLAIKVFNVPIALVSLVDRERQWFKSRQGLDAEETSREVSFCAHALHSDNALVVQDTLSDPRFADNPLVIGEPRIRFYAGYPLKLFGNSRVGTLCLIDSRPHNFSDRQVEVLSDLASMVVQELMEEL
jgi:phosphoribosyl 1,2-cyclic phosphodiesterase/DNA-binding response OmpR family regulator